ncbi:MAG: hypothetical protein K2X81_18075 [Candidatus Obscuribacterales bacterium]|nr:hypothetical protein [Candidatus Obscuribacterales bacterium]
MPGLLPYTISLFAHNAISVGNISNPNGYIAIRGGGTLVGNTFYAGSNPATISIGKIDIFGASNNGVVGLQGQVWVDNFGGNVSVLGTEGQNVPSVRGLGKSPTQD